MGNFQFNVELFIRTLSIFALLTSIWTGLAYLTNDFLIFWNKDRGFITGLVFLLILAASIFFGQKLKGYMDFGKLAAVVISTFCFSSFILFPLVSSFSLSDDASGAVYCTVNSLFVSVAIIACLNRITYIQFKWQTTALTFLLLLMAYYVIFYSRALHELENYTNIRSVAPMFVFFQSFMLIPLTLGMNLSKPNAALGN